MQSLVIDAVSLESAKSFCAGLNEFDANLIETENGRYQVEIPLNGSDRKIIAVLNALEAYVTARGDGPARIEYAGHKYAMHPQHDS